ncbi:(2Fe-2S) ferredoxin domain-containing protein [candidate division KSB1 bacterium]|nr:(2Fe-2S) ferredoxin domain-containing protein [candidate division KSB1 bacterium]
MQTPEYHIFVCNSFRVSGEPQGICNKKGAVDLLQYLENEILDRGLDAMISSTGCLKACEHGPIMIIYPKGWWYGGVTENKIDDILDALEDCEACSDLLINN